MATAYVAENTYCASDYCEVEVAAVPGGVVAFPVPAPGQFVSAGPDPSRLTFTGSPPSTRFPGGPYGTVLAAILGTHTGNRIFSAVQLDPVYAVPPAVGRYVSLLSVDPIVLAQGGSGSTLVTRINSLELPSFSASFDNTDGFWSRLVASEYVLCLSLSLYLDLGDGIYKFCGRGEIQSIEITRKIATFRIGA